MKQFIDLVILGLLCRNVVLAQESKQTKTIEESQSGRIINGQPVNIEYLRYVLSLWEDGQHICSASIITVSHALTAAHCVYNGTILTNPSRLLLVGGTTYLNNPAVKIKVSRTAAHPNYSPEEVTSYYDVAVLTVPRSSFARKSNMAPIVLQTSEVSAGTGCYVVGWGMFDNNVPQISNNLRYTYLNILSAANCSSLFETSISNDQVCAINGKNMEVCIGDSGSALVCGLKLTGIVSWGNYPCTSAYPVVYTKVVGPNIRNFIRSQARV